MGGGSKSAACESAMNEIAVSQRSNSESAVSEIAVSEGTMSEIAVSACSECDRSECCHAVATGAARYCQQYTDRLARAVGEQCDLCVLMQTSPPRR